MKNIQTIFLPILIMITLSTIISCNKEPKNIRIDISGILIDSISNTPIRNKNIHGNCYIEKTGYLGEILYIHDDFSITTDTVGKFQTTFKRSSRNKKLSFINEKNLPFFETENEGYLGSIEYK